MRRAILIPLILGAFAFGKNARVMYLSSEHMGTVKLQAGRATILSFPTKPEKVVCGNKNLFSIEFVENDVIITPLSASARSNLFTYLLGRRFGFDLVAGETDYDEIIIVRDDIARKNERDFTKSKNKSL